MKVIITGGCGFIGTNIALRKQKEGCEVILVDDLSRPGTEKNLKKIQAQGGAAFYQVRVEDKSAMWHIFDLHKDVAIVYHMAAQTAVTKSIEDPIKDLESNIIGTVSVLEAIRSKKINPFFIYASTNKVYGSLADFEIKEYDTRYDFVYINGIRETAPIDFHSPYGCSKGAADQYVRDYARVYGLDTVVFRQSCIYGEHQIGVEDQGWLSWFTQQAIRGEKINIFGNGKQVRDVLHVDDLIDLYDVAYMRRKMSRGNIFNAGGGPKNKLSLLELVEKLENISGKKIEIVYHQARSGDQKVYVSFINKAMRLGWEPKIGVEKGISRLYTWTKENL
jgi:CDP-paratose 2-epimerase